MFGFKKKEVTDTNVMDHVITKKTSKIKSKLFLGVGSIVGIYLLVCIGIGIYWSREPDLFSVTDNAQQAAASLNIAPENIPVGFTTVETLKRISSTLINKPGGFLTNDMFPPGVWLDNIPSWEIGVLKQTRDMTLSMQRSFSRSQSQSSENTNLSKAFESFSTAPTSWLFPAAEERYAQGIDFLNAYEKQLLNPNNANGKFYARADNLAAWLGLVETQLGSMSQRLAASVGQQNISSMLQDTTDFVTDKDKVTQTPWFQIDNVFYEARGQAWALSLLLRAVEVDFKDVLAKKEAQTSLKQIIRDLEATQQTVWSPVILNGSGFGFLANHSLVMASYISRANAAIIDLRRLLEQG